MAERFPNPGEGYTIREYLGGGHWKSAYRASTPFRLADVALLFFHDNVNFATVAKDVANLIRAAPDDPNSKHLARFYSVNRAPGGRIFIVEELLARPLDRLAPLNDLTQFVRIARDLSRGLLFLHKNRMVHRDLKLDNCGLDHQQQAKIFDLGSVTSEPGDLLGTIFTRAPELFAKKASCDSKSDVWALGATLFALRSGDYPFVDRNEIEERRLINRDLRNSKVGEDDAQKRKQAIDVKIRERITRVGAEEDLIERVNHILRGRSRDVLLSMLKFDKEERAAIEQVEGNWTLLAREFAGSVGPTDRRSSSKWDQIKLHLGAVEQNETRLTIKQLDKIISDYDNDRTGDEELERRIKAVKQMLSETR
jgi:serine/threonine protein kinase